MGVTDLGTNVYADFQSSWWQRLAEWNREALTSGFKTYALMNDPDHALELAVKAVENGFDTVELDEMISNYPLTEQRFVEIVSAARAVKPDAGFIITEWDRKAISQAFQWASKNRNVVVASSDYSDVTTLDYVAKLQELHGLKGIVWLIFIPDPAYNWRCTNEIGEWVAHAKELGITIFLWSINADGTWSSDWATVKSMIQT